AMPPGEEGAKRVPHPARLDEPPEQDYGRPSVSPPAVGEVRAVNPYERAGIELRRRHLASRRHGVVCERGERQEHEESNERDGNTPKPAPHQAISSTATLSP